MTFIFFIIYKKRYLEKKTLTKILKFLQIIIKTLRFLKIAKWEPQFYKTPLAIHSKPPSSMSRAHIWQSHWLKIQSFTPLLISGRQTGCQTRERAPKAPFLPDRQLETGPWGNGTVCPFMESEIGSIVMRSAKCQWMICIRMELKKIKILWFLSVWHW